MAPIVSASTLVNAIQSSLSIPIRSHSALTPGHDLYEVYLFGLCIEAATSIGMGVSFMDATGWPKHDLILRTSPSSIWSQAQKSPMLASPGRAENGLKLTLASMLRQDLA